MSICWKVSEEITVITKPIQEIYLFLRRTLLALLQSLDQVSLKTFRSLESSN